MGVFWVVAPTRRYNPEDTHLHNRRCEYLKSFLFFEVSWPKRCRLTSYISHLPHVWDTVRNLSLLHLITLVIIRTLLHFVTCRLTLLRWMVVSPISKHHAGCPPLVGYPRLHILHPRSYPPLLKTVSFIRNMKTRYASVAMEPVILFADGRVSIALFMTILNCKLILLLAATDLE
jgi:hypothetical protein